MVHVVLYIALLLHMMNGQVELTLDYAKTDELSINLMHFLSSHNITSLEGAAACALTMGRLISPRLLVETEELPFLSNIIEFAGMYFTEGGAA